MAGSLALGITVCAFAADELRSKSLSPAAADESRPAIDRTLDARSFFDRLVARYRSLETYEDVSLLQQVTERPGERPRRVSTKLTCVMRRDTLRIESPESQLVEDAGLKVPLKRTEATEKLRRRYDLWLAPHMALRFLDQPLSDLRAGTDEGFTPTRARSVIIDNRALVHLELRSGDGLSEDCKSKFSFYVDPESMLIARIDGQEYLADGATMQTTLDITPVQATLAEQPAETQRAPAPPPRKAPTCPAALPEGNESEWDEEPAR